MPRIASPLRLLRRSFTSLLLLAFIAGPFAAVDCRGDDQIDAQFEQRAARYWKILERNPRAGTAFDLLYRHYLDAGRLEQLQQAAEAQVKSDEQRAGSHLILGLVAHKRGQTELAETSLARATKLDTGPHSALAQANFLIQQLRYDEASASLHLALKQELPTTLALETRKILARVQLRRGKTKEAEATFAELTEQFPDDARLLQELAELLYEEQLWEKSLERWEQLAALVKEQPFARMEAELNMGQLELKLARRDAAIKRFDRLLDQVEPESWIANQIRELVDRAYQDADKLDELAAFWRKRHQKRPEDLATRMALARALVRLGEQAAAVGILRELVQAAPAYRDGREALIAQLLRTRQFQAAVEQAQQLAVQLPRDIEVLDQLGRLHLQAAATQQLDEAVDAAIAAWERIAAVRPDDPALALQVAENCRRAARVGQVRTGDSDRPTSPPTTNVARIEKLIERAEFFYREAVRRAPQQPSYREYLGEFLYSLGRDQAALAVWKQMAEPPLDNADNLARVAELLADAGFTEAALEVAQRGVKKAPERFALQEQLAQLLMRDQKPAESLRVLERLEQAATTDVQRHRAIRQWIDVVVQNEQAEEQIAELQKQIRTSDPQARQLWRLGLLLGQHWQLRRAAETLKAATEIESKNVPLRQDYADTLNRLAEWDEAKKQYQLLAEMDGRRRADHLQRVIRIAIARRQFLEARDVARRLVQLSPSSVEAHRIAADVAFETGMNKEGLASLQRAIQLAPRDVTLRMQFARTLESQNALAEAKEHYWRCLELATTTDHRMMVIAALSGTCRTYEQREQLDRQLIRKVSGSPNEQELLLCRVRFLLQQDQPDEARDALATLLARNPNDIDILAQMAELQRAGGDFEAAVLYQKRLAQLAPSQTALIRLATDHHRLGNRDDVMRIWSTLLERAGSPRPLIDAADKQLEEGRYEDAWLLVQFGCERYPRDWELLFRAAYASLALQRVEQATDYLARLNKLPPETGPSNAAAPIKIPIPALIQLELPGRLRLALPESELPTVRQLNVAARGIVRFSLLDKIGQEPHLLRYPGMSPGKIRVMQGQALQTKNQRQGWLKFLAMPDRLADAKLEAAAAEFRIAVQQSTTTKWLNTQLEASRLEPVKLRDPLLILVAAGRLDTAVDLFEDYAKALPHDPLPHLTLLTADPYGHPARKWSSGQKQRWLKSLHAGMRWLQEHRPGLTRHVSENYGTLLMEFADTEGAGEFVGRELANCTTFDQLNELVVLTFQTTATDVQSRFVARAAELSPVPAQPPASWRLRSLLSLTASNQLPLEDDGLRQAVLQLIDRWLSQVPSAAPSAKTPWPQSIQAAQQQILQQEQAKIALYSRRLAAGAVKDPKLERQLVEAQLRALSARRQALTMMTLQQPRTLSNSAFPGPSRDLPADHVVVLQQLYDYFSEHQQGDAILAAIRETRPAPPVAAARFQMARVCLLWWSGKQDEALEQLEALCDQNATDGTARFQLARGRYMKHDMRAALRHLDQISTTERSLATQAKELREQIDRRWSSQALLGVIDGHSGVVRSVVFGPKGERIASASVDRTVKIWDVETRKLLHTMNGHEDMALCVSFAPSGKQIASGSYDRSVRIWDTESGKAVHVLKGHNDIIRCLAYSPDGKVLASGGDDSKVRLWNADSGELLSVLEGHRKLVFALAFSADGKWLASGSDDESVIVWNRQTGGIQHQLKGHWKGATSVAFGPGDRQLYSSDWQGTIRISDVVSGESLNQFRPHQTTVRSIAIDSTAKLLVMGCDDRSVRIWNLEEDGLLTSLRGHAGIVQSVTFSPSGKSIASASYDGRVHVWSTEPIPNP